MGINQGKGPTISIQNHKKLLQLLHSLGQAILPLSFFLSKIGVTISKSQSDYRLIINHLAWPAPYSRCSTNIRPLPLLLPRTPLRTNTAMWLRLQTQVSWLREDPRPRKPKETRGALPLPRVLTFAVELT